MTGISNSVWVKMDPAFAARGLNRKQSFSNQSLSREGRQPSPQREAHEKARHATINVCILNHICVLRATHTSTHPQRHETLLHADFRYTRYVTLALGVRD